MFCCLSRSTVQISAARLCGVKKKQTMSGSGPDESLRECILPQPIGHSSATMRTGARIASLVQRDCMRPR